MCFLQIETTRTRVYTTLFLAHSSLLAGVGCTRRPVSPDCTASFWRATRPATRHGAEGRGEEEGEEGEEEARQAKASFRALTLTRSCWPGLETNARRDPSSQRVLKSSRVQSGVELADAPTSETMRREAFSFAMGDTRRGLSTTRRAPARGRDLGALVVYQEALRVASSLGSCPPRRESTWVIRFVSSGQDQRSYVELASGGLVKIE